MQLSSELAPCATFAPYFRALGLDAFTSPKRRNYHHHLLCTLQR